MTAEKFTVDLPMVGWRQETHGPMIIECEGSAPRRIGGAIIHQLEFSPGSSWPRRFSGADKVRVTIERIPAEDE